jgi:hypothetical protein
VYQKLYACWLASRLTLSWTPGNHHSTLSSYGFAYSRYLLQMKSCSMWVSVADLLHLVLMSSSFNHVPHGRIPFIFLVEWQWDLNSVLHTLLGSCSSTWSILSILFAQFIFEIKSYFFVWASMDQNSIIFASCNSWDDRSLPLCPIIRLDGISWTFSLG